MFMAFYNQTLKTILNNQAGGNTVYVMATD
jgi:hypothetical protein